ncbi:homoserine kinase [Paracidobacterium acidisoli]|uniref:Homoserine kinase n=1 Tax=Paracidobacterium acidisoli TaxID=2303751 RepID=A0A372IRA4_9BACT|nr:homoserine kinase [Paracidobacterium acidisoli]MBT9330281.1 homoserine kinase [Paracidobacterium acidisoli]
MSSEAFRIKLPATSANLGPGFDTLALALRLYLEVEAEAAASFSIEASGRNQDICGALEGNLLLETYSKTLTAAGRPVTPLRLRVHNEIPLGMGCGSSAAVRLAGVSLAAHFGGLGWDGARILTEASRLEGHPDNAAACWLGGFTASGMDESGVQAVSFAAPAEWRALVVMPQKPLATTASRAVLPERYSRADVVVNLQSVALLTAAFAARRADLLVHAMRDRIHQPYRAEVCPLLPALLPLAGQGGIPGVALSGAGPAVLALLASEEDIAGACERIREALPRGETVEILACELAPRRE